jgi:ankyrin repeat protein
MKFISAVNPNNPEDVSMDIDKMMFHCLNVLGALQCIMGEYNDKARANVFWGAVQTISEIGLDTGSGQMDMRHPGAMHLLRAFPSEQKATDGRGWLPLHWAAVTDNVDVADVLKVARSDPMATTKGSYDNQPISANPGHLICAGRNPSMDVVRCLFNFYPRMASVRDNSGDLPIHYAARYSGSVQLIQFLLQANPAGTKQHGEGDLVPLQAAFFNETANRLAIVRCLLEADISVAALINSDGDTALHLAVVQECELELLSSLVTACPESARKQNDIGFLPLHAACYSKGSLGTVRLLLSVFPEGARMTSMSGLLPANIAAECSSAEVLDELLKYNPDAINASTEEDSNNTPLIKAVIASNEPCVRYICDKHPSTVRHTNVHGRNAFHVAAEGENVQLLRCLHASLPDCAAIPDRNDKLALHVFLDVHQDPILEAHREAECLRFILRCNQRAVRMPDKQGNTPLMLCHPDNVYPRRLLLMADPTQNPAELKKLNYAARRMAIFLTFSAINADGIPNIFCVARAKDPNILKLILSFL